jgi:sn-glycerol 3-phosphate transport system substrate-binding protein
MGRTALAVALAAGSGAAPGCGWGDDGGGGAARDPAGPARAVRLASCDGPPPGQRVEIRFVHTETDDPGQSGDRADLIAGYVAAFEDRHPDVDVEVLPDRDGRDAVLARWRRLSPGERPELVLLPHSSSGRMIDSGQTVAPGTCIRRVAPDMLPSIHGTWSSGGVLQAVPFAVSTPVLLYNRRVFRAARLDPGRPPDSLDEVALAAHKVVDAGAAEHGLVVDSGSESGASWMIEHLGARVGEPALEPGNGRSGPATTVAWRSGPALRQLRWLADGIAAGWAVSVGRNASGRDNLDRAADPDTSAGMTLHTSGALGEVFEVLDTGAYPHVDLGVAPLPTPDDGPRPEPGPGSLPGGSALWLAGGKSEAETAAAWALASYLASPPVQADWAAATGYVPISPTAARRPPVAEAWRRHPGMRVAYDVLVAQETTPAALGPLAGPLREIRELQAEAVDRVVGGADPAEALTAAADDADHLLRVYAASRSETSRPDR